MSQSQPPVGPVPPGGPLASGTERTASIFAHLSALIAAVISVGWLSILGPLIVYLVYKDRSELVRRAAAGAFNFNLAVWALIIIGWICLFTVVLIPVTIIIWIIAGVAALVCHIVGAVKASHGETYDYPFQIRVLH